MIFGLNSIHYLKTQNINQSNMYTIYSNYNKKIGLPSIAAVPIAVGIMSPEALIASNLDIRTDILKNKR